MPNVRIYSVLLLLLATLLGSSPASAADEAVGKVVYAFGEVSAVRGTNVTALHVNAPVYASDSIVTGDHGRIKLVMNDASHIYISRKSRISLEKYATRQGSLITGAFNLLWGKARFIVEKLKGNDASFTVRTTTAVLGVRGTNFIVSVEMPAGINPMQNSPELPPLPTRTLLEEGSLHLRAEPSGREAMLEAGRMAVISPAGGIDIRPYGKGDLQDMGANVSERLDSSAPAAVPEVEAPDISGVTVPVVVRPPTAVLGTVMGARQGAIQVPVAVEPPVIVEQPLR